MPRPTARCGCRSSPICPPAPPSTRRSAAGEAARIMTGSPVPTAADAIVPFEDTAGGLADSLGEIVVRAAPRGAPARTSAAAARTPAPATSCSAPAVVLGPLQLAAAAAAGVAEVVVSRRPRVAVVSTGSELVPPGEPLERGQIPESNSELLAGLVAEAGCEVVLRLSVPDEGDGPRDAVAAASALGADVVVFTGRGERRRLRARQELARGRHGVHEGRDAAGQAAGLRRDGRRDAAVRPPRKPGERGGVVRGVRPPRAARAPGPHRARTGRCSD